MSTDRDGKSRYGGEKSLMGRKSERKMKSSEGSSSSNYTCVNTIIKKTRPLTNYGLGIFS